jgi:hypothetical protein
VCSQDLEGKILEGKAILRKRKIYLELYWTPEKGWWMAYSG